MVVNGEVGGGGGGGVRHGRMRMVVMVEGVGVRPADEVGVVEEGVDEGVDGVGVVQLTVQLRVDV